ncbi:MAG: T9SS type A sorting domain-containing protein [Bacteroidetes bacterium]|nr:T9SS type A sorting domain-containing protein [Bacteroidota bacterium]
MKKIVSILLLGIHQFCFAQINFGSYRYSGPLNFELIKESADSFFKSDEAEKSAASKVEKEDNDYLRYKRWEWYWKDRVNTDGSFPDLLSQAAVYNQLQGAAQARSASVNAPWVNISQTSTSGGYDGMGRLTSIAFHPTDPNIFWVGAPIGGIWKTLDGGATYSPLGDGLPYCSVGNILVDPSNPDIIYITLGDHGGWWNYGLGMYKSTDGGLNWAPTTLISNFSDGIAYYAMAMSPTNPNVILVAKSDGLFRTNNGGNSWTMVHSGGFKDVKFRPGDSTTVYAASDDYWGSSEVYKSTNGGINFTAASSFNAPYNRIKITVTAANPNIIGVMLSGNGTKNYYKSSNSGASFSYVSALQEDAIIFISPLDSNIVYSGYTKIFQSTNGGINWVQKTNWYNDGVHVEVHADEQFVAFNPLSDLIYFCNDGGLYNYDEVAGSWAELSNGLIITQFYSIAVAQSDPVFMIGGTQDNGGRKRTGLNSWASTNGGDAMETAIDQSNTQIIYTTYVDGQLYRSMDRWTNDTYHDITPAGISGNWVTPYLLDPSNQSTIYAGYEDVYKSTDRGNTWNKISNNLTGSTSDKLDELEISTLNSNVIYAARENKIYTTTNGGVSWANHSLPFALNNFSGITSIAIDPVNPAILYATVGGYSVGVKVYKSVNSGNTWSNISSGLPNVPVSSSVFDESSPNHELYIGTDIGIFYRNDTSAAWTYYGSNLPNTSITDLKIQYATHKLRAATYGRGIWEADLLSIVTSNYQVAIVPSDNSFRLAFNPIGSLLQLNAFINSDVAGEIKIYDLSGNLVLTKMRNFPKGNYQLPFDISMLAEGMYMMNIETPKGRTALKFIHTSTAE